MDLSAPGAKTVPNKVEIAQKTYFIERWNGSVITVTEREAHALLKNRQPVVGFHYPPNKLIGVSDGRIYQQAVLEAHQMHKEGKPQEEVSARLRRGWNDEFEAAKGKIELPRDFDNVDKYGNPISLSSLR